MNHYRGRPGTNSHSSSSMGNWGHRYSSTKKHSWKFCGSFRDNLTQIQLSRIWNTLAKRNKGIKPALLWEFLARMKTKLWKSQATLTAMISRISLSICLKSGNLTHAAARKPGYFQKKKTDNSLHFVFAHVCHQLENGVDILSNNENVSISEGLNSTLCWHEGNNNAQILAVKKSTEARGSQMFEDVCAESSAEQSNIG